MDVLKPVSDLVEKRPREAVALIVVITLIMMGLSAANPQDPDFDQSAWAPEHESLTVSEDLADRFETSRNVPILLHATNPAQDPNILTPEAMVEIIDLEWALTNDTRILDNLTNIEFPLLSFVSVPHLLSPVIPCECGEFPSLRNIMEGMTGQEEVLHQTVRGAASVPGLGEVTLSLLSSDLETSTNTTPLQSKATLLLISLNATARPGESDEAALERIENVEFLIDDIVTGGQYENIRPAVISQANIDEESKEADEKTTTTLLPLAFLLIMVILLLIFRSFFDFLFSLLGLLFTMIWVAGFVSIFGLIASPLAAIVPILLVGLGVDYGIHLTMRYREELVSERFGWQVDRSARLSILSVGAALVLATITTMVGFFSNLSSSIQVIKEFGLQVGLGVFSAFVIFVVFVPACKLLLDRSRQAKGKELLSEANETRAQQQKDELTGLANQVGKVMDLGATGALAKPEAIVVGATAISIVMFIMALNVSTVFSFNDFLPQNGEITEEILFLQDNFDFSDESSLIYVRGDDLATAGLLSAIHATQLNMADDSYVIEQQGESPTSALTIMQDWAEDSDVATRGNYDANFSDLFAASDTNDDGLPEKDVAQLFDWFATSQPEAMADVVYRDPETDKVTILLIRVKTDSASFEFAGDLHEELKDDSKPLEKLESSGTVKQVAVTGEPIVIDVILSSINESMISSILITVLISSLVLTAVFYYQIRSRAMGIVTTIPVILVLTWILGSMYIMDMSLNVVTILIAALSIGLGITYAIHISHRFLEELEYHGEIPKATHHTVMHTGNALLGAALTTMIGFGVLRLSEQVPFQQFGTMLALTIFYSFLSSVFVLPSLLVLWARKTQGNADYHPLLGHGGHVTEAGMEDKVPPVPRDQKGDLPKAQEVDETEAQPDRMALPVMDATDGKVDLPGGEYPGEKDAKPASGAEDEESSTNDDGESKGEGEIGKPQDEGAKVNLDKATETE